MMLEIQVLAWHIHANVAALNRSVFITLEFQQKQDGDKKRSYGQRYISGCVKCSMKHLSNL